MIFIFDSHASLVVAQDDVLVDGVMLELDELDGFGELVMILLDEMADVLKVVI